MTVANFDDTIDRLTSELRPVRRLPKAALRAVLWAIGLAVVAAAAYFILGGDASGLMLKPYAGVLFLSAVLTAGAAAYAAFQLSLPDRSDRWLLLPLPPALVWVALTVVGCVAGIGDPLTFGTSADEVRQCLTVILSTSIPLSALLLVMLRRASPLRPVPVALMAGLATASAAASILFLVNPHNSTILDVAVHTACIAAVVTITGLVGTAIFRRRDRRM